MGSYNLDVVEEHPQEESEEPTTDLVDVTVTYKDRSISAGK